MVQYSRYKDGTTKARILSFLSVPYRALQSDRCLVIFHGGNTGSNPVSDAKSNQQLTFDLASLLHVTVCNVKTGAANFLPSAWIWGTH